MLLVHCMQCYLLRPVQLHCTLDPLPKVHEGNVLLLRRLREAAILRAPNGRSNGGRGRHWAVASRRAGHGPCRRTKMASAVCSNWSLPPNCVCLLGSLPKVFSASTSKSGRRVSQVYYTRDDQKTTKVEPWAWQRASVPHFTQDAWWTSGTAGPHLWQTSCPPSRSCMPVGGALVGRCSRRCTLFRRFQPSWCLPGPLLGVRMVEARYSCPTRTLKHTHIRPHRFAKFQSLGNAVPLKGSQVPCLGELPFWP